MDKDDILAEMQSDDLAEIWHEKGYAWPSGELIPEPKRKRGRPKIHPDRKAYQAEWVRKKRAKLTASKAN